MISTVAVGTDGSETAAEAVTVAAEFARRFDAKVVLVSAYDAAFNSRRPTDPEGYWDNPQADRMRETLERAEADLRGMGVDATAHLEEGEPAEVLVRMAEECEADLLVVGSKGMQRRVLGSVPNTVTHRAHCSVVVVKTT
jgi:nucleotide-binding universal stress UspA family protein